MKVYILLSEPKDGSANPKRRGITLSEKKMKKWINTNFKTVIPSAVEGRVFAKNYDVELAC